MKLLTIGMDGVHADTFNRGWTPFIKSLIDRGHSLTLHEDLISRGWSEIMLGKHAYETGALYEGPLMGGSLKWSDKFKLEDVPALGVDIKPIWQVLNERGYRVGIMNIPTTFPAPKVDGFFVSGGGGGGPISKEVSPYQCHPTGLDTELNDGGYIVDQRNETLLGEADLYDPKNYFAALEKMNARRVEMYVQLATKYQIDFGFLVFKSSPVTAETFLLPELEKKSRNDPTANYEFINAAEDFYRAFDAHIRTLIETYSNTEVLLVSDHSMALRKFAVNSNAFLIEAGLQTKSRSKSGLFKAIKSFKHLLPNGFKAWLKKNPNIKSSYQSMVGFNHPQTRAFSIAYTNASHGIYVNDSARFGGPVAPADISKLTKKIVQLFNEHSLSKLHGMQARAKGNTGTGLAAQKFPDVVLTLPDSYHTSSLFVDFVTETPLSSRRFDLYETKKDIRSVGKAHTPLAVCTTGKWNCKSTETSNLTAVYDHIQQRFPALKNRQLKSSGTPKT
tara:strand:- start:1439 stop:2947 length:1509 start_codon:yes stop_codon:yes gene_type:complete